MSDQAFRPEFLDAVRRPVARPWHRLDVYDEDGQCAGGLRKATALWYAEGRASARGGAVTVSRVDRKGCLHVIATFYAPERHTPAHRVA